MHPSNSFKRTFLKNFLVRLQQGNAMTENMSFLERKNAIKLTSDVALAVSRENANWSRAIIANACRSVEKNKAFSENKLLGESSNSHEQLMNSTKKSLSSFKRVTSKRILRKSYMVHRRRTCVPKKVLASAMAKKMFKKRTQLLKCVVPGGEFMDELCLFEEAADYILYLRAQVSVMRGLVQKFLNAPVGRN